VRSSPRGKTSGIGYAVAERLAFLGCDVVIADLGRPDAVTPVRTGTRDEMEAIAAELGGRYGVQASAVEADVTDPASSAGWRATLRERWGHIHILVTTPAPFGVPADISPMTRRPGSGRWTCVFFPSSA